MYTNSANVPVPGELGLVLTHTHSGDGHAWPVVTSNRVHRKRTQINKQIPSFAPNRVWPVLPNACLGFKHNTTSCLRGDAQCRRLPSCQPLRDSVRMTCRRLPPHLGTLASPCTAFWTGSPSPKPRLQGDSGISLLFGSSSETIKCAQPKLQHLYLESIGGAKLGKSGYITGKTRNATDSTLCLHKICTRDTQDCNMHKQRRVSWFVRGSDAATGQTGFSPIAKRGN